MAKKKNYLGGEKVLFPLAGGSAPGIVVRCADEMASVKCALDPDARRALGFEEIVDQVEVNTEAGMIAVSITGGEAEEAPEAIPVTRTVVDVESVVDGVPTSELTPVDDEKFDELVTTRTLV